MNTFIGVDLGWYGKPTGLASIHFNGSGASLGRIARIESTEEILDWIQSEAGTGNSVAAVDAPLVIHNPTGIRPAERDLNREFRRYHAGCHAANLGRPFAQNVIEFSRRLEALGFRHGAALTPRARLDESECRFQIEVHPHAASVSLFELPRIVKYKRGPRDARAKELRRFRSLLLSRLPRLDPPLAPFRLPSIPRTGNTKPVEDQIDAVLCAYIAYHWWHWGTERNTAYGSEEDGYIVVPRPRLTAADSPLHGSQNPAAPPASV